MTENNSPSVSFTEAVLLRPKMYTLDGTFNEVVAFLEGYYSGLAKGNPYIPSVRQWVSFHDWFTKQLGVSPHERLFTAFKATLQPNQEALAELLAWWYRFQSEFPETDNQA